jgi:hypothetical protein
MAWTRYDVFLSYSRTDAERVQPMLDELRRHGYHVFFDLQSIDPGQKWKKRLERSIRASRTLVLCWSEHARGSDYITFEYSSAEALGKPVYPWLLDRTPLPAMLELQGINDPEGAKAATALRPYLGWTLARRRMVQALSATVIAIALAFGIWRGVHPPPPPPWEFEGVVTDRQTEMPIGGVEVDVETDQGDKHIAHTDAEGNYMLRLPQPQPKTVTILFRKDGYEAEHPMKVLTGQPFNMDMAKLRQP